MELDTELGGCNSSSSTSSTSSSSVSEVSTPVISKKPPKPRLKKNDKPKKKPKPKEIKPIIPAPVKTSKPIPAYETPVISVETPKCKNQVKPQKSSYENKNQIKLDIDDGVLYSALVSYILSPEQLLMLGYPVESSIFPGKAVILITDGNLLRFGDLIKKDAL